MKNRIFLRATGFIALFSSLALFATFTIIIPQKPFRPYDSYEKYWAKVDSLEKLGLTESSKKEVESIRKLAKKDNNYPQLVKSLIYLMKYSETLDEDAFKVSYNLLQQEIRQAPSPYKQVLYSLRGNLLWNYYQNYRWQFYNRTPITDASNDDILTWDLNRLFSETIYSFCQSLSQPENLQKITTDKYIAILEGNDSLKSRRPTLYDILAYKAIEIFQHAETGLTQPANSFEMNRSEFFMPAEQFSKYNIPTTDTLNNQYQAILIYQKLLEFHVFNKQWDALVDADLNRLKFVYNHSTIENKDSLYIQALDALQKKYITNDVTAEVLVELASTYKKLGETYDAFNEQTHRYRMDILKALQICEEVIQRFPKTLGANNARALKEQILLPTLEITTEHGNLPGKFIPVHLRYRNLQEVHLRLYSINHDAWVDLEKRYKYNHFDSLLIYLRKQQPLATWQQTLKSSADLQNHTTEIALPPRELGFYVLLASDKPSFDYPSSAIALSDFWVTNLMHLSRPENNYRENTIVVAERESGHPAQDVEVRLYQEQYNYINRRYESQLIRTFKTNKQGELRVPFITKDYYNNFRIELRKGKDRYVSPSSLYQYKDWYEYYDEKGISIHYFLDRSIFRPGQTVHFKGIVINRGNFMKGTESKIVTNYKTTIKLFDANYQEVSKLNVTSNEFGTFSGSFELPMNLLTGEWTLGNEISTISFSVEEYKRPKFEILFDTIRNEFRLGDQVTVSGSAKALSGFAVDGAQVSYRIYRNAMFPPWFYYWRGGLISDSPRMEIAGGSTITDENGAFSVTFEAIPDRSISKKWEPTFYYTIEINVTDINGETRTATRTVQVGYASIQVRGNIPNVLNVKDTSLYKLEVLNMENYPAENSGQLTITRLEEPSRLFKQKGWGRVDEPVLNESEYHQAFPHLPFANEHLEENWKRGEVILNTTFNNKSNNTLKPANLSLKQGVYLIEAKTLDGYGETASYRQIVKMYDLHESKPFAKEFISYIPIKTSAEPGEEALFLISTAAKQLEIRMEIEHRGQMVSKQIIMLSNTQKLIRIPVKEIHRGGFDVHFTAIIENRAYTFQHYIEVPYSNKDLKLKFATFRNELLPGVEEEWKITVKDQGNQVTTAEILVSMYDASLDAFRPSKWWFNPYTYGYSMRQWASSDHLHLSKSSLYAPSWTTYTEWKFPQYQNMANFGCNMLAYSVWMYRNGSYAGYALETMTMDAPIFEEKETTSPRKKDKNEDHRNETRITGNTSINDEEQNQKGKEEQTDLEKRINNSLQTRSNFAETAFFYPHLQTNEQGEVVFSFRMPESITRWNFQAMAHTRDLKFGMLTEEVVTKKQLMVNSYAPRFFREGDILYFSTKVTNLSNQDLPVKVTLSLTDAIQQKDIALSCKLTNPVITKTIAKGKSEMFVWKIEIPQQVYAITYQIVADGGVHSDGEEMSIPVLSNRILVTESLPLPIRGKATRTFRLEKLRQSEISSTIRHHRLTLEFTSQPAWYAIQALPYMMEYPHECSEQTFNRLYANALASHIANSNPRIKKVFDVWKTQQPGTLLSNLEKNQELKEVILQETPWVMDAKNETERKQRIALLFDLNRMKNETASTLMKLEKLQVSNGGWPWFAGGPDNRFITQYIVTGFGRLKKLGVQDHTGKVGDMISKALYYLDERMQEDYHQLKKYKVDLTKKQIGATQIQYLFARSYFPEKELDKQYTEAYNFYFNQAKAYWNTESMMMRGMIALIMQRANETNMAQQIIRSLSENAIRNEEMGMYWKQNNSYFWYDAPIETQALMIEAFSEVMSDKKAIEDMQLWLLKNKQTNDWKTTKATADACYALLMQNITWLEDTEPVVVKLGSITIDPKIHTEIKTEAGTGYYKTSWGREAIRAEMGEVSVQKNTDGIAWGALYWQYFEDLDKITSAATNVKITKKLFKQIRSDRGPILEPISEKTVLKVGDKVKVRIEIQSDRNLEYVHLKDLRASAFEPENVFSGYRWQDGLGYYESTRDAASHFFIEYLPRGTYVFEYPVRVTHRGVFSNGITTLQCMYAPEFSSHSEGLIVNIDN
ncbi:MAG: MG2 domain-containing protein [Flavobacteriales bacterium]|nr:MG2 domain-containing protein [Flavobacteriales bacterium]